MFVADGRVIYSASDLAAAARCEYALLRAFDAHLLRGPEVSPADDLLARTAALGSEHEQRHLDEIRSRTVGAVTVIGRPSYTIDSIAAAADATRRAVGSNADVIYQAAMFDGRFVGFADFLIREGDGYRLRDTKLARSVHVEALLQLAAYADALMAGGIRVHEEVELVLGSGALARYRIDEVLPVYRSRRDALEQLLDSHFIDDQAVRWGDQTVRACLRCPECRIQVTATDDLLLVAGMRVSQRARLIEAGVTTMTALARHDGPVPQLAARSVGVLRDQARLQIAPRLAGKPPYEIVDANPLALLPNPDRGDLFFDFEGDPLWTANGSDWGLEYLFGVLGTSPHDFQPLWAHNRAEERKALVDFLALVRKRRTRHPHMHIYHYAAYEKTALLKLAGRYGEGEDEIDDLLRNGVLVDLYPLVRKCIRVGTTNYSLKSLEPLYMGSELRDGDVTNAADSITQYGLYRDLRVDGRADEATAVLKEIEDYNHYDCRSTRKLRDWLITCAFESEVAPIQPQPVGHRAVVTEDDRIATTLNRFAGDDPDSRTPEQIAVAMIAASRGYHRREEKPFWWAHFDRINNPVDEWSDNTDVFVADSVSVETDWHRPSVKHKLQRRLRIRGSVASGGLSERMFALYEPPSPEGLGDDPQLRGCGSIEVADCDDPSAPTDVVVIEREPKNGSCFPQLPFALTPRSPVPNRPLAQAIEVTATAVASALPTLPDDAVTDILLRRAPRTRSGVPIPHSGDSAADITAALLDLDSSYIAVHGPPGTGKTFTASRILAALIAEHHWRIGVVAQSHAVVEHLLCDVIAAGAPADRVAKKKHTTDGPWRQIVDREYAGLLADPAGAVIGGTAWDFTNVGRIPPASLDLLVIEEAGQFCMANTIAVAPAARNLLLLGDPQQLPQVSQGTHPEPVDGSALGWLVEGRHTLSAERGYFLDRSHRMHPTVCDAVSRLSYDGRLHSVESVTAARQLSGHEPGVKVHLIPHEGNSTDSPEEADWIVAEIQRCLGATWTDEHGTRTLTQDDVLVVTPYNAQVVLLRRRLDAARYPNVRAGTVDKFQGRQAPLVFVSMAASSVADIPRGSSFLLNRNRLNVAISRAKFAAVIVRSTLLADYLPASPDRLLELGAFLSLAQTPGTP